MDGLLEGLLRVYKLTQWIRVLYGKLTVVQRITNFPIFLCIYSRLIKEIVCSSDYMVWNVTKTNGQWTGKDAKGSVCRRIWGTVPEFVLFEALSRNLSHLRHCTGICPIWGTVPEFAQFETLSRNLPHLRHCPGICPEDLRSGTETAIRMVCIQTEIRTESLPLVSLKLYHLR